jgi:subtilase family serine protease
MNDRSSRRWPRSAGRPALLGVCIACSAVVGLSPRAAGQSPEMAASSDARARLPGHLSRLARPEYDIGEAPATLRMSGLQLILAKTPAQEEALKKLIADQQNPRSPLYHHWLTPQEFGARFGASEATIGALSLWLESQGLKVGALPAGRDYLPFSGTKEQVEVTFGTPIHAFDIKGERHYSNIADPSIPASFKGVIAAIRGLNDFHPRPGVRVRQTPPTSGTSLQPEVYEGQVGSYGYLTPGYVGPGDAANIYDLTPLYANNINGKGVTVGVVAQSDISAAQLSAYLTAFGVSQTGLFTSIPVPAASGGSDPGQTMDENETEAYLDTEIIGGLAPGANILLVRDKNANLAAQYIIDQDFPAQGGSPAGATSGVGVINISFGTCEAEEASANTAINSMFQKAVTEGITITVSSGDAGANQAGVTSTAGCMNGSDQGVQGDVASTGLAVNGLASTPYTLSVGGTDFDPNLEGKAGGLYWSTTNAAPNLHSTAAHVPEMVWNSSCGNLEWSMYFTAASPLAFCNTANLSTVFGTIANPFIEILGGGGGVSSCTSINAGACAGGYAQPSWQQNVAGISSFGGRAVPDVSAIANRWIICSYNDNPCNPVPAAIASLDVASGTSAAAPAVAAILALVDQSQQVSAATYADGRQGLINPTLYQLGAVEYGSAANLTACNASQGPITSKACVFYDVTLGGNAQPCAVATFSAAGSAPASVCDNAGNGAYATGLMTAGSAVSPGSYSAGQGYDLATGLGSVDAANLVAAMSALAAPSGLTATTSGATVTLKWSADSSATSFNVYQGTAAGQEGATAVQTGITTDTAMISGLQNATNTTISGLANGSAYYFTVAAVDAGGTSAQSSEASATPAAPPSSGGGGGSTDWLTLVGLGALGALRCRRSAQAR